MTAPVLVTGATGNVGGAVARSLAATGVAVRVAGPDPAAMRLRFPDVPGVRLDFADPGTFESALAGAGGLFLLRPPQIARVGPTLNALVDAAARHGVGHVVFSSVTGADTNVVVPHHRVETHLRASGLPYTILRPGFFAQNLADAYRRDIREENRIYLPAGSGRAAFVDTRDLGDVAATVFADPAAHAGAGYPLTGAEALDFDEVAAVLTEELGRPIRYHPATVGGYLRHLRRRDAPLVQALVQTVLHTGLRRGQAERVDPTLPRLLGRAPRTLRQYVHEHRELWR
ncbi:SDR family oxidoreductase [Micromonospora sp. R77]|uniref:SDR family oxidoreductase n=1 Tax=Micromonospora sp. R77 TaxID=2925836 RepID=UPI001F61734E|nr:SDR family oxidoreductase [Micromonospora sp. R77]MCI4066766.1 SDR family oxidoreductase [Micromonospora sp. R77]